ncbi:MAG TPA: alpha/beta fold hydrolase [Candidatus Binatia bacterium]|nr:alpha/beta fold hydrolase [Candidatus Binatia bacterium]
MELHFERFGHGAPVLILHGLFGSSTNWRTVAKKLGERYCVYAVDQRNHGRSPHADTFGYDDLAADALAFLDRHGIESAAVIGHSMGGKAAMKLSLAEPDRVAALVVVDIAPTRQSSDGLRPVLDALLAVDPSACATRDEVDRKLAVRLADERLRQFLLMNVARGEDGALRWRLNLPAIAAHFAELAGPIEAEGVYDGPALFVRGEKSGYVRDADRPAIARLFLRASIVTIEGAGHWVHAEAPERFLEVVGEFLSRSVGSDKGTRLWRKS